MSTSSPPKDAPIIHRVTIAGRVINPDTSQPISTALVELTSVPDELRQRLSLKSLQYGDRWQEMCSRPDRTLTAIDGFFYFVDLPDGEYKLTAYLPKYGNRYDRQLMRDRDRRCYSSQPITVVVPTDKTMNIIALSLAATVKSINSQASQDITSSQKPVESSTSKTSRRSAKPKDSQASQKSPQ